MAMTLIQQMVITPHLTPKYVAVKVNSGVMGFGMLVTRCLA